MTVSFDDSIGTPPLAEAIDRHPLITAPNTCLADVVKLMYDAAERSHQPLDHLQQPQSADSLWGARSSCVLVMQDENLLGIFTERDLVQLTAVGTDLRATKVCDVMHHPVLTISEQSLHNVFAAIFLFRRHRIRHLAIADEHQQLIGVVSLDSIRHILRPTNLLKIRRVAEVMTNQVTTASPTTRVDELTELMAVHQISCVVIVEKSDREDSIQRPVGIVTERDIVRFQALGLNIGTTKARAVMSTPLFVLSPEDSLWTAHQAMEQRQVRRLVVSWNWGQELGIVTQTSILRVFDPIEMHDVIETLQRTIQQLGLDLDKVLANAIDHDTHLSASIAVPEPDAIPNLKTFLNTFQLQIKHLVDRPELTADARQAVLQTILSELQQFQNLLC
ncbi:CBS domain-containing protein [Altericista sp. CCNU0014]|uniref:CBS domain-containing protein n=1 Tax=Altericista sp. CCNU0014 TaxID=3082949 RepID=UPI00384E35A8